MSRRRLFIGVRVGPVIVGGSTSPAGGGGVSTSRASTR